MAGLSYTPAFNRGFDLNAFPNLSKAGNNNGFVNYVNPINNFDYFSGLDSRFANTLPTGANDYLNSLNSGLQFDTKGYLKDLTDFYKEIMPQDTGFLGLSGKTWGGIGALAQGLAGLGSALTSYQNYKLAKKQFGFEKAMANRNLANQAKIINNTYNNAAQVAAGMIGGRDSNGNYGYTDPSVVRQYEENAKKQHVDGSAI